MGRVAFASLVFKGERFSGPAMPLEVLSELAAYRDLILAVARGLWQAQHPDRVRLPKGFEASFRLVLAHIEDGSTAPLIEREIDAPPLSLVDAPVHDFFNDARALLEHAIAGVSEGESLPWNFPPDAVGRFAAFGRSLRQDEHVILAAPHGRTGPAYGKEVRKKILLRGGTSYEDTVTLQGQIRELDKDGASFHLRSPDGQRIRVRYSPLFFQPALRALEREDAQVRVVGLGRFSANDELQEVSETVDVSPLEEEVSSEPPETHEQPTTPLEERIAALEQLQDGWLDGQGRALDATGLAWARRLLSGLTPAFRLPVPFLYPTPEGHLRAEWPGASYEVAAEFDLKERVAELIAVSVTNDSVDEAKLRLSEPGQESLLGAFVSEHLRSGAGRGRDR